MALRLQTDATCELVTMAEIKSHLRLSTVGTAEDTLLTAYVKTARKQAENLTKRSILQQVWKLTLDDFPTVIRVPRPPLSSTASEVVITFLDETSGDSTTLSSTGYTIDSESEPARIYPSYGNSWPNTYGVPAAVTIDFTAGSTISAVDEDIKTWVKLRAGSLYENREAHAGVELYDLPRNFIDGLLDPHVIIEVLP